LNYEGKIYNLIFLILKTNKSFHNFPLRRILRPYASEISRSPDLLRRG